MNGSSRPASASYQALHEVLAGLDREHRVVERDAGHPRQRPVEQVLERRPRRRGHRDRVAVAAEAAGHPDDVHGELLGRRLARGELDAAHARALSRSARSIRHAMWCAGGPVEDQPVRLAGDEPGARQAAERVRDRRPLGADELADQPVGERQRDEDPVELDDPPALGEVPEQERDPHVGARMAGRGALHVELASSAGPSGAGARGGSAARAGSARRTPRRGPRSACARARANGSPRRAGRRRPRSFHGASRSPAPTSSEAVRSPTCTSSATMPSISSRPRPPRSVRQQRDQIELARRDLPHARGDERPRDEPHPQVEPARRARRRRRTGST